MHEHLNDAYVKKSKADGYRSRASYKLLEINEKDSLLKSGMTLIDLGSAPGGWSQVAAKLVGPKGLVIATDILLMEPIENVHFVQGDFTEDLVIEKILTILQDAPVDLVISDMAPNMSGIGAVDQPRAIYLIELALDLCCQVLRPGGDFLVKVFHGAGFDELLRSLRSKFNKVQVRKPGASRARSKEQYLLARGYRG
jgi:23S rRNA (uridine2552-2'-O)-methyltransferase